MDQDGMDRAILNCLRTIDENFGNDDVKTLRRYYRVRNLIDEMRQTQRHALTEKWHSNTYHRYLWTFTIKFEKMEQHKN